MSDIPAHLSPEVFSKVEVRKPVDYVEKYQDFLTTTDEKAVIASAVGSILFEGSIIDIGAGTGDIPDILGIDPQRYTAIEQRPEFIDLLKSKGYSVIESLFPCEAPKQYDNALMSYVLYGREQCEEMIDPAWELVKPEGQLIAVTYRDNEDDYNRLLHRSGHTRRVNTDTRFNYLEDRFSSLGQLAVSSIRSHIYSSTVDGLAAAVSFMATNTPVGTPEMRHVIHEAIVAEQSYLDETYRTTEGEYQFPIDHYLFTTQKA